jgi:hypothetical protein
MLDPVNGTSERVLDPPEPADVTSDVGNPRDGSGWARRACLRIGTAGASSVASTARIIAATVRRVATKLSLLHQSALRIMRQGRMWLCLAYSRLSSSFLRLAKRKAPRLYEISRKVYRGLRRGSSAAPQHSASLQIAPTERVRSRYDAIAEFNIVDNVAKVTRAFHERLGLSTQQSPVSRCLASVRTKLAEEIKSFGPISAGCSLERFELAWRAYAAGKTQEALHQFRDVIADERLAQASAADPRSREAFVRAAEILGHHAELRGDLEAAGQHYRRILELDGNGVVARRLLLMLWREGRLREAAELAPRIMQSDCGLVQHLRGSDAVADLTRRLGREVRRQSRNASAGGPELSWPSLHSSLPG